MYPGQFLGIKQVVFLILLSSASQCNEEVCGPNRWSTPALPPDNRFLIEVNTLGRYYIPNKQYTVSLYSRDKGDTFVAFLISAIEDTEENPKNQRKPRLLNPGMLYPSEEDNIMFHKYCNNTLIESDVTPKNRVQARWRAPPKGNKCVTIYAIVAVKPDVWYSYEGPLSRSVCEDLRKAEDMPPLENGNCQACEEARYQLLFEGMWSPNTHPGTFPQTVKLARFSDVVGASHNQNYNLYKFNSEATPGLKMLAEQGNTTTLEIEIQEDLGVNVRTLIKASSPRSTDSSTISSFRVNPEKHMVSIATALLPSPDWFLGASNLELCDVTTNQWTESVSLNLYPLDAGTDSGLTFESSNEETLPHRPISSATIGSVPKDIMKPFARLKITLIRTYSKPECQDHTTTTENQGEVDDNEIRRSENSLYKNHNEVTVSRPVEPERNVPRRRPTTTEPPEEETEESTEEVVPANCPVKPWGEWQPCEGKCVDGVRTGMAFRYREFKNRRLDPECIDLVTTTDFQECQEDCSEETTTESNEE